MNPYYTDGQVSLYYGDMREILPALGKWVDAVVTDPPYGETSLAWDRWPQGWPSLVADHTDSLWCFGSMRMFTSQWSEFEAWNFAQDIVWEKHNGSGFAADRFKRVHELALHFYRGAWNHVRHETPREPRGMANQSGVRRVQTGRQHTGVIGEGEYHDTDRLRRSVIRARSRNGTAIHPTEKPVAVLAPLIEYSVPKGGHVLDPFAGSSSTLLTARMLGRCAIGIEADERYCEAAAKRLDENTLPLGALS